MYIIHYYYIIIIYNIVYTLFYNNLFYIMMHIIFMVYTNMYLNLINNDNNCIVYNIIKKCMYMTFMMLHVHVQINTIKHPYENRWCKAIKLIIIYNEIIIYRQMFSFYNSIKMHVRISHTYLFFPVKT